MKHRPVFYSELAYFIGNLFLALGTAMMSRADFGMSMVVAPAYLLHLKLSNVYPFFSFGMAEYCLQALILVLLAAILRRFKLKYLFSFATAVIYGLMLDGVLLVIAPVPSAAYALRAVYFVLGLICCCAGVALVFHTYITQGAYELFVKEMSDSFGFSITRTKTVYDLVSFSVSVALSFLFFGFGHFEAVKFGTVICAMLNGFLIGKLCALLDSVFEFRDALSIKRLFK